MEISVKIFDSLETNPDPQLEPFRPASSLTDVIPCAAEKGTDPMRIWRGTLNFYKVPRYGLLHYPTVGMVQGYYSHW